MLFFSPAWIEPTVTTATSRGSTSRDTIVCSRMTVAAAITTGSIVECGREPCPPRPSRVTVSPSDAAICVPERTPIVPAGQRRDVLAEHDVGLREAVEHAVGDHRLRAGAVLLGGLEDGDDRARPLVLRRDEALERAEQRGDVHVVTARVHDGHVGAGRVGAARGAGVLETGALLDREARPCRRAARRPGPSPFADRRRRRRSCRCPPRTRCRARSSCCATTPAVRVSWNDSSGCRCRSM